jgi:hypothetical protein
VTFTGPLQGSGDRRRCPLQNHARYVKRAAEAVPRRRRRSRRQKLSDFQEAATAIAVGDSMGV